MPKIDKKLRLELLSLQTELDETFCRSCQKGGTPYCFKECPVGEQLREIGRQLTRQTLERQEKKE
ncbi:hypothetical protein Bsel_0882 [[Bacillus] selenitireducens MLS10]|uniref:Uncharacterized protein n=1 Tax=Bacillus selenitireducens (strain ATCC 700615 / DSM 15326 / MLS10) TaxID=439292 RepID=D6XZN1_BACIE|nr:hypothetical protein Bsel_0882 [[Bacillus] selenitireducens MLS10]